MLPQSGWPVTRQLLFSRLLVSVSSTGGSPTAARSSCGRRRVVGALDVQPVQAQAVEFVHRLALERVGQHQAHADGRRRLRAAPGGFAQVGPQPVAHFVGEANCVLLKLPR
jgi:hypothetical protein